MVSGRVKPPPQLSATSGTKPRGRPALDGELDCSAETGSLVLAHCLLLASGWAKKPLVLQVATLLMFDGMCTRWSIHEFPRNALPARNRACPIGHEFPAAARRCAGEAAGPILAQRGGDARLARQTPAVRIGTARAAHRRGVSSRADLPHRRPALRGEAPIGYHDAVADAKRAIIREALQRTGNHQTRAAELLGLSQPYLARLMKNMGLRD
jgi:hypothetical protein